MRENDSQDCIAELELPLTFKLQFLEEVAEEKRKNKKSRKAKAPKLEDLVHAECTQGSIVELVATQRKEITAFWAVLSIEEKWCLTEMSTAELAEAISASTRWETLRSALESYAKYAWEEDVLEITEDCVTIADDMCEEQAMLDTLESMLDALKVAFGPELDEPRSASMSEDDWDKTGRQMLETLVLAEFAKKLAVQYMLKARETRAQQVALELEQELIQEEEEQRRCAEKKAKANKKKRQKQKQKSKVSQEKPQSPDESSNPSMVIEESPTTLPGLTKDYKNDVTSDTTEAKGPARACKSTTTESDAPVLISPSKTSPISVPTVPTVAPFAVSTTCQPPTISYVSTPSSIVSTADTSFPSAVPPSSACVEIASMIISNIISHMHTRLDDDEAESTSKFPPLPRGEKAYKASNPFAMLDTDEESGEESTKGEEGGGW